MGERSLSHFRYSARWLSRVSSVVTGAVEEQPTVTARAMLSRADSGRSSREFSASGCSITASSVVASSALRARRSSSKRALLATAKGEQLQQSRCSAACLRVRVLVGSTPTLHVVRSNQRGLVRRLSHPPSSRPYLHVADAIGGSLCLHVRTLGDFIFIFLFYENR